MALALAGRDEAAPIAEGLESELLESISSPPSASSPTSGDDGCLQEWTGEARFLLGAAWLALGRPDKARSALGQEMPSVDARRDLGENLRSPARQAALLLSVLIDVDPESPWIVPLVERLNGHRIGERWGTTQENGFALLALGKYARMRQSASPPASEVSAEITAGGESAPLEPGGSRVLRGDLSGEDISVRVEGDGALYWYLEESGVPEDGALEEVDAGIAVRRRYLDARGEDLAGRTLPLGEVIQVEIRVEANRPLPNVAITDLLPAALEIENPRLRSARSLPGDTLVDADHVDIRDDRIIVHLSLPESGKAVYRYAARAVTRGEFALPAIAAECLYDAGIFSRSGAGRVKVDDGT